MRATFQVTQLICSVNLGTCKVKPGKLHIMETYQVKLGTNRVYLGTCQVNLGTCQIKLGTCQGKLKTCQVKLGTISVQGWDMASQAENV